MQYEALNPYGGVRVKASHLVLMVLSSSPLPVEGRTAIQKMVYFSSVKSKSDVGFHPHFYGPYSPIVASALQELVLSEFILESARVTIRDRPLYSYSLTKDGTEYSGELIKSQQEVYEAVSDVVTKCRDVTHNNISVLSWAAKVYFMLSARGGQISYDDIKTTGKKFGWKLEINEIESGMKLLSALALAHKSPSI